MSNIGLKGSWKRTKGERLKFRLQNLKWELKYAWQRAWRGYDAIDVFNMDFRFIEKYKEILKHFKETNMGLFCVPEKYKETLGKNIFTEEETDMIIDMMIYHLEMMDEDHVEKILYEQNKNNKDYLTSEEYKRIYSIVDQNKEAFMKLFNAFFWNLWY